jgi:hypothetical protein
LREDGMRDAAIRGLAAAAAATVAGAWATRRLRIAES